jgi:hypothetical protein
MIVLPTLYQMVDLFLRRTLKITAEVLWLCGQVIKALRFQRGSKGTPTIDNDWQTFGLTIGFHHFFGGVTIGSIWFSLSLYS